MFYWTFLMFIPYSLCHLRGIYSIKYINDTEYDLLTTNLSKECYYFGLCSIILISI